MVLSPARLSVFGRFCDDSPEHAGEYAFFLVDPQHEAYHLARNVIRGQMYVAEFRLEGYPVQPGDLLHVGKPAWDAALATVNVGKVQLGRASICIAEHALHEAIAQASERVLYGTRATDFTQVRRMLLDAYVRLLAMKLYSAR